mmetsp:Transcript_72251/g.200404  ORF Transcript_72251/g.200404 Transcript_72251/m.200404 type:complete len:200 (+) Transcript_72251:733-1332(+)
MARTACGCAADILCLSISDRNCSKCVVHLGTAAGERPRCTQMQASQFPLSTNKHLSRMTLGTSFKTVLAIVLPGTMLKHNALPTSSGYAKATRSRAGTFRRIAGEAKNWDHAKPAQSRTSTTLAILRSRILWLCKQIDRISTSDRSHSTSSTSSQDATSCNLKCPTTTNDSGIPAVVPCLPGNWSILKFRKRGANGESS